MVQTLCWLSLETDDHSGVSPILGKRERLLVPETSLGWRRHAVALGEPMCRCKDRNWEKTHERDLLGWLSATVRQETRPGPSSSSERFCCRSCLVERVRSMLIKELPERWH
jgi:hypothetical protein